MVPKYVPAHDPRHRTACFALYKALLRLAPEVALPEDLVERAGPVNPIKHLIRRGFWRNKRDVPARLVVSSLSNGYKFLTLLSEARTAGSPQHRYVVEFLTRQQDEKEQRFGGKRRDAALSPRPASREPSKAPEPIKQRPARFLERIPNPAYTPEAIDQPKFHYAVRGRPRPLSALGGPGKRRVPRLVVTADGFPFLRVRKPQPHRLGAALAKYGRKRARRIRGLIELADDRAWEAEQEDAWDALLAEHMGLAPEAAEESSFVDSVRTSLSHESRLLFLERLDMVERSKALMRLVDEEKALDMEERTGQKPAPSHWDLLQERLRAGERTQSIHLGHESRKRPSRGSNGQINEAPRRGDSARNWGLQTRKSPPAGSYSQARR